MGGGETRALGYAPVPNYRDAVYQSGTHVTGLTKPANPLLGETWCAGSVSRPREGRTPTDTPITAATDDICWGGTDGVFGYYQFYVSLTRDERRRN